MYEIPYGGLSFAFRTCLLEFPSALYLDIPSLIFLPPQQEKCAWSATGLRRESDSANPAHQPCKSGPLCAGFYAGLRRNASGLHLETGNMGNASGMHLETKHGECIGKYRENAVNFNISIQIYLSSAINTSIYHTKRNKKNGPIFSPNNRFD